jgi:hypothetical protein
MLRPLIVAGLAVALASAGSAGADEKAKGKSKSKGKDHAEVALVFSGRDRDAARAYWVEAYGRGKCPPGLAKKNNGCLPPGQAKKRYVVGRPLPPGIIVQPVPPVLLSRLDPVPSGYEYAVLDGDLVKLAVGTRLVIDAISAMVD